MSTFLILAGVTVLGLNVAIVLALAFTAADEDREWQATHDREHWD